MIRRWLRTASGIGAGLAGAMCVPGLMLWMLAGYYAFLATPARTPSALADAAIQAFPFAIYAAIVAGAHAVVLGVPAFLLLRRFGKATWRMSALAGGLIGLLPFAIYAFPRVRPGWSSGAWMWGEHRRFYVDGVPTLWEWLSYAENILMFAVFGASAALAFWLLWRRFGDQPSSSG